MGKQGAASVGGAHRTNTELDRVDKGTSFDNNQHNKRVEARSAPRSKMRMRPGRARDWRVGLCLSELSANGLARLIAGPLVFLGVEGGRN